ncbi:MAG: putative glycoside hydrolase, partial [bacterium]|nr:putative glycoside hydrolase [bacterium]
MALIKGILGTLILGGGLFLFLHSRTVTIPGPLSETVSMETVATSSAAMAVLPLPEAEASSTKTQAYVPPSGHDLPPQAQLQNPPIVVKGIYVSGWTAGSDTRMTSLINLVKRTELNAMVIDIKDYSGFLSYAADIPLAHAIGAERELRIARPNALIKRLHDNGIYVIARVTVFQDPILSKVHPEWALQKNVSGTIPWTDNKGLGWMDPAGKPTWDYAVAVSKDALARGFDEVNFDYIRFASDGDLGGIKYPFWDKKTSRHKVIAQFFNYLRARLGDARISADLFGLATINRDDLGIGQVIEDAYAAFDDVAPMTYPSHYAS